MNHTLLIYLVFGAVIILALVFDLDLISKKNTVVTLKNALMQTVFWVVLALVFGIFIWFENGMEDALQYISAYLLEWSLSIDNIFVFIIIFSFFEIREKNYSRVLLLGILMAIIFRVLFIAVGSELVARFEWIMYIFGVFLVDPGLIYLQKATKKSLTPEKIGPLNW